MSERWYYIFIAAIFLFILIRSVPLLLQRADCYNRGGFPYTDGWNTICFSKDLLK